MTLLSNGPVHATILDFPRLDPANDNVATSATANQTGAIATSRLVAANTINATVVKASAGRLYHISAVNGAAGLRYVKIYDKATAPDPSAGDIPIYSTAWPASALYGIPHTFPHGLACANGIAFVIVTGAGDTDETAPSAGDVIVTIGYV